MTQITELKTPVIDCGPAAISAIISCQKILANYILPNSGTTEKECINQLMEILDDRELVESINRALDSLKSSSPKPTGEKDKNGADIFEGDGLSLQIETIRIVGIAKYSDVNGEWEVWKDEGNHVGIANNRHLITKL